ncbi:MAG: hypothetical protein HOP10_05960 [Chitinophagaceae bacterium]|nr:hypothetical protein [Chitinophagaceae bacterium]
MPLHLPGNVLSFFHAKMAISLLSIFCFLSFNYKNELAGTQIIIIRQ